MVYDFCLDDLTVLDYIILLNAVADIQKDVSDVRPLAAYLTVAAKCCNINPMELPMHELKPFIEAFNQALDEHNKDDA